MSILSALIHKRITPDEAVKEGEAWVANEVSQGFSIVWHFFQPLVQQIAVADWPQAVQIVAQALTDIGSGDLADLETSVLNKAEAMGFSAFKTLESQGIQALIAVVRAVHLGPQVLVGPPNP